MESHRELDVVSRENEARYAEEAMMSTNVLVQNTVQPSKVKTR